MAIQGQHPYKSAPKSVIASNQSESKYYVAELDLEWNLMDHQISNERNFKDFLKSDPLLPPIPPLPDQPHSSHTTPRQRESKPQLPRGSTKNRRSKSSHVPDGWSQFCKFPQELRLMLQKPYEIEDPLPILISNPTNNAPVIIFRRFRPFIWGSQTSTLHFIIDRFSDNGFWNHLRTKPWKDLPSRVIPPLPEKIVVPAEYIPPSLCPKHYRNPFPSETGIRQNSMTDMTVLRVFRLPPQVPLLSGMDGDVVRCGDQFYFLSVIDDLYLFHIEWPTTLDDICRSLRQEIGAWKVTEMDRPPEYNAPSSPPSQF